MTKLTISIFRKQISRNEMFILHGQDVYSTVEISISLLRHLEDGFSFTYHYFFIPFFVAESKPSYHLLKFNIAEQNIEIKQYTTLFII